MKTISTVFAVLCLAIASSSYGKGGDGYINPGMSISKFDGNTDLKDNVLSLLGIEYQYNEQFGGAFSYIQGDPDVRGEGNESSEAHVTMLNVEGIYYLPSDGYWHPYISGGVGLRYVDKRSVLRRHEHVLIGGGVRYDAGAKFSFRAGVKGIQNLTSEGTDAMLEIGLSWRFDASQIGLP